MELNIRLYLRLQNILFVLLACVAPPLLTLNLDGSPESYVVYPPWEPCLNGSFSLEFKTEEQHSLLVYLNKGDFLFFELKLLKGSVRLRVNIGEGTMITRAGQALNDNKWHTVEVKQDGEVTTLKVDGVEHSKHSPGIIRSYVSSNSNDSLLYLGGLPPEYQSRKYKSLALPSVVFEPRFRGSIRNLFYRNCGGEPERPSPLESYGILTKDIDMCERGNPCLNGGRCLTTDRGLYCDCSQTEYKGSRCDLQKIPSDATFLGTQYLSYNVSTKGKAMISNQDQIMLDFRTKQPSSLLFYTGNSNDYITVGLLDGGIFMTVNLGSGMYQTEIRPSHTRFDDNRWHQLVIRREAKEVSIELDGMYREQGSTTGKFVRLSSMVLFVAGSPSTETLAGSRVRTNFKGCMRKVRYQADSIRLDLTELARQGHGLLEMVGDVIFDKCRELVESQPVTFTTPESYVTVPTWDRTSLKGSLAFQFRTVEPGGLMMYSNGDRDSKDFFALELLDGHLYLVLDMGSGIQKVKASRLPITDGHPHDVYFEFSENKGYISIDGQKTSFTSPRISDRFDLHGHLYVGGLGPEINITSLPRELWAATLGVAYVGCLQDLVLNGNQVDLMAAAKLQNKSDIVGYCRRTEPQCISHPCNHRGKCIEGWNRFMCDCRATGFDGPVCQSAAVTLRFDGTQFMKVTMTRETITQAEDISVRFRTMHPSGLLFLTTGQKGGGMDMYLEDGVLYLSIDVGSGAKVLSVGHTLNDDRWHTVFIKRRMQTVEVSIDQDRPVTDEIPGSTFALVTSRIIVGHVTRSTVTNADLPGRTQELGLRSVETGHMVQRDEAAAGRHSGFIGSMQSFIFNGNNFFHMAKSGSGDNIEISARFSSDEYVVRDPVTFKSVDAFAILPRLQAHDKFSITLQLKTTESDGLILYNGGSAQDFFAIELFQGFLYYVYDMGEGPQRVKANVNQPVNDNKWHEVRLLRAETYKQLLRVDDNTPTIDDLTGAKNNRFDLGGHLYVGGVRKTMYPSLPKQIFSHHGFVGCLGSLDLNGYLPNLLREASPIHESVGDGCRGPLTKCVNDSCANHGRCVQQWTSYKCDCDMTSYTGPMCKDESISYKFGPGPGLITFTYPEGQEPSTNFESLAFGFKSFQDEAVLLRMDSKSYDDFIQLELVNGNVYLIYNMGTVNHPLGNFYQKVNDGRYHVVRFTRAGPNATLQIDSAMPQMKHPTGPQSHTFNNQAYIRIGGKKAGNGSIIQHFEGFISGLVLNGIHIFELAKQKDPKIRFEGNVSLNIKTEPARPNVPPGKDDTEEMQSTQGRRRRMNPALRRYIFQTVRKVKDPKNMRPSKKLRYTSSNTAKLRPNRSRLADLQPHYMPQLGGRTPNLGTWKKYTVLEPNRQKYEMTVRSGDPDNQVLSQHEDDTDYLSSRFKNTESNKVHHLWSEENSGYSDPSKFGNGRNGVDNRTMYVYNPDDIVPGEQDNGVDNEENYDVATDSSPPTITPKPRCYYSGAEGLKTKSEVSENAGETAKRVDENAKRVDENVKRVDENVKRVDGDAETDWSRIYKHYDTVDTEYDITNEEDGIFDMSHPDYYLGNIEDNGEGDSVKEEDREVKRHKEVEETVRQFSEAIKTLRLGVDNDDEDEDSDGDNVNSAEEGSGLQPLEIDRQAVVNATSWSARYKLAQLQGEKLTSTTILPYMAISRLPYVVVESSTNGMKGLEWDYFRSPHTTPREGVTDDIIFAGAGSGCQFDDEEDCSVIGSGTEEEIITAVVFFKTTTAPPTTTVKEPPKCVGPECETSSKLQHRPDRPSSTLQPPPPYDGEGVDANGNEVDGVDTWPGYGKEHEINGDIDQDDSTAQPGQTADGDKDDDKEINLGLILGITGSVLVAVIVLCIALCKLRSRDEGTYKVDETQNFSALQSKKSAGNGTVASGSESCTGKRGKKKDVKEWYV